MNQFITSFYVTVITYFIFLEITSALLLTKSKCPDVKPISNFNLTAFGEGVRYEIARYPNDIEGDKCISYEVKQKEGGLEVKLAGVSEDSADSISLVTRVADDNIGTFYHTILHGSPKREVMLREHILAIDYDKYHIGYDCNYDENTKTWYEHSWIVVRSKNPDDEVKTIVKEFIDTSTFLDAKKFKWFDFSSDSCKAQV